LELTYAYNVFYKKAVSSLLLYRINDENYENIFNIKIKVNKLSSSFEVNNFDEDIYNLKKEQSFNKITKFVGLSLLINIHNHINRFYNCPADYHLENNNNILLFPRCSLRCIIC